MKKKRKKKMMMMMMETCQSMTLAIGVLPRMKQIILNLRLRRKRYPMNPPAGL